MVFSSRCLQACDCTTFSNDCNKIRTIVRVIKRYFLIINFYRPFSVKFKIIFGYWFAKNIRLSFAISIFIPAFKTPTRRRNYFPTIYSDCAWLILNDIITCIYIENNGEFFLLQRLELQAFYMLQTQMKVLEPL